MALAQLGSISDSQRALKAARNAFDDLPDDARSDTVFGFSERRFRFYESRVLSAIAIKTSELEALKKAEAAGELAISLYPDDVLGDPTLIRLDRAVCLVRAGHIREGCQLAGEALNTLPAEHRAAIFLNRARDVLRAVPERHHRLPDVRQYVDILSVQSNGLGLS
jgi:hypothetical protein